MFRSLPRKSLCSKLVLTSKPHYDDKFFVLRISKLFTKFHTKIWDFIEWNLVRNERSEIGKIKDGDDFEIKLLFLHLVQGTNEIYILASKCTNLSLLNDQIRKLIITNMQGMCVRCLKVMHDNISVTKRLDYRANRRHMYFISAHDHAFSQSHKIIILSGNTWRLEQENNFDSFKRIKPLNFFFICSMILKRMITKMAFTGWCSQLYIIDNLHRE